MLKNAGDNESVVTTCVRTDFDGFEFKPPKSIPKFRSQNIGERKNKRISRTNSSSPFHHPHHPHHFRPPRPRRSLLSTACSTSPASGTTLGTYSLLRHPIEPARRVFNFNVSTYAIKHQHSFCIHFSAIILATAGLPIRHGCAAHVRERAGGDSNTGLEIGDTYLSRCCLFLQNFIHFK